MRSLNADRPAVSPVLNVVALVVFASTLFTRAVDPVIPQIASDLAVDVRTAALLSTAFTLPYALMQPVLGPLADVLGKTRIMIVSLALACIAALICAVATSFSLVVAMRVVAGIVTGGIFPVGVAIVADRVPMERRQVAIGRVLAAAFTGNLAGSTISGVVGDLVSWRGVFASFGLVTAIIALVALRGRSTDAATRFDFAAIPANYRSIFANPRAKICFGSVFVEGIFLHGLFPYVAILLLMAGEPRASIAGLMIAGFAFGGILYTFAVGMMLARLSERSLMLAGGALVVIAMGVVAIGAPWPVELVAFVVMGFGFYSMHACIQLHVTELSTTARGSAMALHSSSFFLGQATGPVVYGFGIAHIGSTAMIGIGAIAIFGVALFCARYLAARSPPS